NATVSLEEYQTSVDRLYRINSTLVHRFYVAGIDYRKMQNGLYLLATTRWAGLGYLLRFLWHGTNTIVTPKRIVRRWSRDVLFGNIQPGNRIAASFLALAENDEALLRRRSEVMVRQSFIEQET